jgi:mercuric reductase
MTVDAEMVLVARGRTPNVEGLGLAEFGVVLSPKGAIVVVDARNDENTALERPVRPVS